MRVVKYSPDFYDVVYFVPIDGGMYFRAEKCSLPAVVYGYKLILTRMRGVFRNGMSVTILVIFEMNF